MKQETKETSIFVRFLVYVTGFPWSMATSR